MQANRTEKRAAERVTGGTFKNIEAIYPLSPMQEGMLFHTLMNPGTGIYLMQNRYYVEGEMDAALFRRAGNRSSHVIRSCGLPLSGKVKNVPCRLFTRRSRRRSTSWTGGESSGRRRLPISTRS